MFYLELFRALQDESVEYVVVGGIAINMHGIERATMDIDLVLAMTGENLQRFLTAARRLDLHPVLPVPIESLCDLRQLDEWVREKHMIGLKTGTGRKVDASDIEALEEVKRLGG